NGMAGALIIEGPFDDWLKGYYKKTGLREKVLLLQQPHERVNFLTAGGAPRFLINGQAQPVIEMRPGEVQRWRLISATMEGAAQITVDFDGPGGPVDAVQ